MRVVSRGVALQIGIWRITFDPIAFHRPTSLDFLVCIYNKRKQGVKK